jgi:hypothetical protein
MRKRARAAKWIRQHKHASLITLVRHHLALSILGANLHRKRRTTLMSTTATAVSTTLAALAATSTLVLALLSALVTSCLLVLLQLHWLLERLLHRERNMWNRRC